MTDFSAAPKDPTIIDMGSITVRPSEQPASNPTVWKTFTGNIVKLVGGKQDSKKDDPALRRWPQRADDSLAGQPHHGPAAGNKHPAAGDKHPAAGNRRMGNGQSG